MKKPSVGRPSNLVIALSTLAAAPALAHVKWFSQSANLMDRPLPWTEILTPTFYGLAVLSVVVVMVFAWLDDPLQAWPPYQRLRNWLKAREDSAFAVMRIATGMSLLLSWGSNTLLAPELTHSSGVISWLQFIAILSLLHRRTTPLSGVLIWALFAAGVGMFGAFHMLDYAAFVGIAFYLVFHDAKIEWLKNWAKPVLYGTTGLSLAWLSLEKLVYPTWALTLLQQHPVLSLSLPPEFFLTGAAFVEFSLGALLVFGVLGRPLAAIITLVFFLTSMVFGKEEIVGHLILHGVLVVFMLEGTSNAIVPPFRFHRSVPWRLAFVAVNFVVLLAVLLGVYQRLALPRTVQPVAVNAAEKEIPLDIPAPEAPTVSLHAAAAPEGGWDLTLDVERFRISSLGRRDDAAPGPVLDGHVHLFVDGQFHAMIFNRHYRLPTLPPGEHELKVQLSSTNHRPLRVDGKPIESQLRLAATVPDNPATLKSSAH